MNNLRMFLDCVDWDLLWKYGGGFVTGAFLGLVYMRERVMPEWEEGIEADAERRAGYWLSEKLRRIYRPMKEVHMDKLVEALAEYAHGAWSHWMKYMFRKTISIPHMDPQDEHSEAPRPEAIPLALVERWQRQMNTAYVDLPESEKESDRDEARKILAIIARDNLAGTTPEGPDGMVDVLVRVVLPVEAVRQIMENKFAGVSVAGKPVDRSAPLVMIGGTKS